MEYKKYKLKELLTIKNGKDHKKLDNGSYPVYGSGGYMRSVDSFLYDDTSILLPRKGTLSNIQFISGTPFWTVDTIYYTILNENLYDPYYLYLYLNSLDLSGYDSGASIPSMTSKTYYSLNVVLPEKRIQTKVANIIRDYDKFIENNNKRIRLLEQMAENLYKEWFVRFRFPGYEDVEFIDGFPKEWKICRMD
jgi:type I restriction enzyme S subunit